MGTRPKRLRSNLIANRNVTVGSLAAFVIVFAIIGIHLLFHSHAATALAPTVPICGERQASDVEQYTGTQPPQYDSTTLFNNNNNPSNMDDFVFLAGSGSRPDEWYVRDQETNQNQDTFSIYNATNNSLISTFYAPEIHEGNNNNTQTFAVDSSGNVYFVADEVLSPSGTASASVGLHYLYKYAPASSGLGNQAWSYTFSSTGSVTYGPSFYAVYSYTNSTGQFNIGVVTSDINTRSPVGSTLFNTGGSVVGTNSIIGTQINQDSATKDLVSADNIGDGPNGGVNVIIYNSAGTETFEMGAPLINQEVGPFHFQNLAGAVELPGGDIAVTDSGQNAGIDIFTSQGVYLGLIQNAASLAPHTINNVKNNTNFVIYNGAMYYISNKGLENITTSTAMSLLALPQGAPYKFGIGGGLFTSVPDNFFPSTASTPANPVVNLEFYKWWQKEAGDFTGTYTVRNMQQILNGQPGTPVSFSIDSNPLDYATTGYVNQPITGLPNTPGEYEVSAQLSQGGKVVGASCVNYAVGAPNVSFTSPAGGPDTQGVDAAAELGQKLYRSTYTIGDCLKNVSALTGSTNISCPADMIGDVTTAAQHAAQDGVTYEMQLVGGVGGNYTLAASGFSNNAFQSIVAQMATQFKGVVTNWECWNEPDNETFGGNVSGYVTEALQQCYHGVKSVSASDKMIGFSDEHYTSSDLQGFINAGGLKYVDIVALHSYTGSNSSFEEQGNVIPSIYNLAGENDNGACPLNAPGILQCDQSILKAAGYTGPVWDTESGFWQNDGIPDPDPYEYYNQGDKQVRKMILEQSIGMNWLSNFYNLGDFSVNAQFWALIGGVNGDAVNPGGLASLNYQANLGGRAFGSWLPTGVPHTYAAQYGTSSTSSSSVVAVWADDYSVGVVPKLSTGGTITVTSEYGTTSTLTSGQQLTLSGQVQYLTVPSGATLTLNPQETFGTNDTLSSAGATVSASSTYSGGDSSITSANTVLFGVDDAENQNLNESPRATPGSAWSPNLDTDSNPSLTITLPTAQTIDRVFVSGFGLGSSLTGLRNYTVEANTGTVGSPNWVTVAQATNLFFDRNNLLTFPAQLATQIKLTNFAINYTGTGDGTKPRFWEDGDNHVAPVYDVEAYGPGSGGPVAPQPPTGLQVVGTPTYNQVNLSWTASTDPGGPGIGGYYILRNGAVIGNSPGKGTTYSDTTVQPSTNYTYSVEAYDTNKVVSGVSGSVPAITPPAPVNLQPPTGLSATSNSPTQINLTWTGSTGATGYYVLRQDPGATTFTTVGQVSGTTDTDTGLVANTTYTYEIEAFDGNGDVSGPSTQASATTLKPIAPPPPTQPTGLQATGTSNTQINLTWTASSSSTGVAGYDIYRVTGTNPPTVSSADLIGSSPTNSYGDTGLSAGTTYTYVVVAYDNSVPPQASPASPPATGSTLKSLKPDEITGVITTKKTGLGIVGAKVTGGDSWTTANSSGVYALTNLGNGTRYYYYYAKGYTTQSILIKLTTTNPTVTKNVALEK